MKRILSLIAIFLIGVMLPQALITAQDIDTEHVDVDGFAVDKNCTGQYIKFINSQKSPKVKRQAIKDAFTLNRCQLNDMLEIDDKLDQVRDELKSLYSACEDTVEQEKLYIKLQLETYFVRNIIKLNADYPQEVAEAAIAAHKAKIVSDLRADMVDLFVNQEQKISEGLLNEYIDEWAERYDERMDKYANCDEGSWAELTDKWVSFKENIDKLSKAFKEDQAETKKELNRKPGGPDVKVETGLNGFDIFKNNKNKGVREKVKSRKTVADAVKEGRIDIDSVVKSLEESRVFEVVDTAKYDRLARYTVLYGYQSAPNTAENDAVISRMNDVLVDMTEVHVPKIEEMSKQVFKKQCK